MKRRWFLRLSALALLAAVVAAGVLLMTLKHTNLQALRHTIENYRYAGMAIRWGGIAFIALIWPSLVKASEKIGHISRERSADLTAQRWRITTWLIVIELLVGQNLISAVWPTPSGSTA